MHGPGHLALVGVGRSVVSSGVGVWASSVVVLGGGLGAGNRDWGGIGNWSGNSQSSGEEGSENDNQLGKEKR